MHSRYNRVHTTFSRRKKKKEKKEYTNVDKIVAL